MLTEDANIPVVRIGSGPPAGTLFGDFWQPVLLSSEWSEPDGAPARLRVLGGPGLSGFHHWTGIVG
jgi:hypothetical protein